MSVFIDPSVEQSHQDSSNEGPQCLFSSKTKTIILELSSNTHLICSFDGS